MKITQKVKKVNIEEHLLACYDVSQLEVHLYSEYEVLGRIYGVDDKIENNPRAITNHFLDLEELRKRLNLRGVHVFSNPVVDMKIYLKLLQQKEIIKLAM